MKPFLIKNSGYETGEGLRFHIPLFSQLIKLVAKGKPLVPSTPYHDTRNENEEQRSNQNQNKAHGRERNRRW